MKKRIPRLIRLVAAFFSIVAGFLAFGAGEILFRIWTEAQFGPAIVRLFLSFSWMALGTVLFLCAISFLFGRFYCSAVCPLGILQDFIGWVSCRKSSKAKNYYKMRFAVAAVVFGLLIAGTAAGMRLLDPFSNFGAMENTVFKPLYNFISGKQVLLQSLSYAAGGLIPFLVIIFLVLWKKRIFCTAVCPVGTVLGICARNGLFGMQISDKCVKCQKCVRNCPAGCIDIQAGTIDNERCVRCMNCLSVCPKNAVEYKRAVSVPATNEDKRRFLKKGAAVLSVALAAGMMKPFVRRAFGKESAVYPPGAGSTEELASRCTSCRLCVSHCPSKIIRPAGIETRLVHLDYEKGFCDYNCHICSQICPTGALRRMTLTEKQHWRIGLAQFDSSRCFAVQEGAECGLCSFACPAGAIQMQESGDGVSSPVLNPDLCIGCGACENACPAWPKKAMLVASVPQQESIKKEG